MSNGKYSELRTQKQYLKLIAANIVNRFGDSIDAIAFSWMMYEVTGSASLMAVNMAVNLIPTILLQPIAGVLVDRYSKKKMMMLCDIGRGAIVVLIAALLLLDAIAPWILLTMTFLISTLESLRMPAGSAIVPLLLEQEHYPAGIALNTTLGRVFELIGTAAAGVVIGFIGSAGALIIDAVTFLLSALLISWIRADEPKEESALTFAKTKESFLEGVRYVKGSRVLIAILIMGMLINAVMMPMNVFLTAYTADFLLAGPEILSLAQLALTGGMALGSFLTPRIKLSKKWIFVVTGSLCSLGTVAMWPIPMIASMLWRQVAFVAVIGIIGFAVGILSVVFSTTFVQHVSKEFLGRVGGLTNSVLCSASPLVSLLCSAIALVAEVPVVLLISGIIMLCIFFAISRFKVYNEI